MKEPIMFSKDHLWICENNGTVRVGLSEYALKKMKTVVFLNLPDEGDSVSVGEAFGDIESLKTVSDLISPVSGTIESVNTELSDDPDMVDSSAWLIEVSTDEASDNLMTEDEYLKFTESEG